MTHPHRSSRTGLVAGYEDLADPDHRQVAAYARLLTVRLAALRDIPDADGLTDACEYRAHLTVAHLAADAMATAVADTGRVEQVHVDAAGYLAGLVRRAHHSTAGVLHFGPDAGDLVDVDTLARLARAAHRGVCAAGADRPTACHPGPGRVRLRLVRPQNSSTGRARSGHRDLEPGCVVHAGAALAEIAATPAADTREVLLIGPGFAQSAVRQYAGYLRAGAIRAARAAR